MGNNKGDSMSNNIYPPSHIKINGTCYYLSDQRFINGRNGEMEGLFKPKPGQQLQPTENNQWIRASIAHSMVCHCSR